MTERSATSFNAFNPAIHIGVCVSLYHLYRISVHTTTLLCSSIHLCTVHDHVPKGVGQVSSKATIHQQTARLARSVFRQTRRSTRPATAAAGSAVESASSPVQFCSGSVSPWLGIADERKQETPVATPAASTTAQPSVASQDVDMEERTQKAKEAQEQVRLRVVTLTTGRSGSRGAA